MLTLKFPCVIAWLGMGLLLSSCSTPGEVIQASDYRVCRAHILRPPLMGSSALEEANRQVAARNLDCSKYAAAIMQEKENADKGLRDLVEADQRKREQARGLNCTSIRTGNIVQTHCN